MYKGPRLWYNASGQRSTLMTQPPGSLVIVGEQPHATRVLYGPLDVHSRMGAALARALDLTAEEYVARIRRTNLYDYPVAAWAKGEARSMALAMLRELLTDATRGETTLVVGLGRRVGIALGATEQPHRWTPLVAEPRLAVSWTWLPSGVNRVFNNPVARKEQEGFLREALRAAREGLE